MGLKHILLAFKSTILVLVAFAVVLFVRLGWMAWSGELTLPFLRTGRIGELALLLLLGAIVAIVLTKLLQLEFRAETRPRKRWRGRAGERRI
jgi:hypothetical protein